MYKPGVLIEISGEQGIKEYLLGDLNMAGGKCVCCEYGAIIKNDTMVLRAKTVYEKK